jgi:hypothetical protein
VTPTSTFQSPLYPHFLRVRGGPVGYSRVVTAWDTGVRKSPYELQAVLSSEEPYSVLPKQWRETHEVKYDERADWLYRPRWRGVECNVGEVSFHLYVPSQRRMVRRTAHVLLPLTDPQPVPREPLLGCELLWFRKTTLHLNYGSVDDETVHGWTGRENLSWGWLEFC